MSLVSNWFLGKLGRLRATPLAGPKRERITLPAANRTGGMPLMQALALRHSEREYTQEALTAQQLSDLLWAADGINRPALPEHTAPSAMNASVVRGLFDERALRAALGLGDNHQIILTQTVGRSSAASAPAE